MKSGKSSYILKLEDDFIKRGLVIMGREHLYNANEPFLPGTENWRYFKSFFGVGPGVCADAWYLLEKHRDLKSGNKRHFLWGLMTLKLYSTYEIMAKLLKVDKKTIRKWAWHFIYLLDSIDYLVVS